MPEQSPSATVAHPPAGRAKVVWSQLEGLLAKRSVIPVIGPDVVVVDGDMGERPLTEYIAKDVAEALGLDPGYDGTSSLNDVACRCLASNMPIDEVYTAVKDSLDAHPFDPPESLRKLARIDAFTLYVTTTFDDLMKRALDMERFNGDERTQAYAYSPEQVEDIPDSVDRLRDPIVYHLLGRASKVRPFVVTEEDTLEFVHALQSDTRSPKLAGEPEVEARISRTVGNAMALAARADTLARAYRIANAIATIDSALAVDSSRVTNFELNSVCWFGTLRDFATRVLRYCERAVRLDPSRTSIVDSRGVARALSGNVQGAIQDFRTYAADMANSAPSRNVRRMGGRAAGGYSAAADLY